MHVVKAILVMAAMAAGGSISDQGGAPAGSPAPASTYSDTSLQQQAEQALLSRVRTDLKDAQTGLRLDHLQFQRQSDRVVEGSGRGFVILDETGRVPIEVIVSYDLQGSVVEHVDYRVTGGIAPSPRQRLGSQLRHSLADRIGARLAMEFADQPVDFALLDIHEVSRGPKVIVLAGSGLTEFPGEGAAYTRFIATADKRSGQVLSVRYELLQEAAAPPTLTAMK